LDLSDGPGFPDPGHLFWSGIPGPYNQSKRRHIKCRPAETGIIRLGIQYTLPRFPRRPSKNLRPEKGGAFAAGAARSGTGKEWPCDAASRIRISNGQGESISFLQGTRRPFQVIFCQPRFFGRLFLKKGAKRTCASLTTPAKDARQKISGMTNEG